MNQFNGPDQPAIKVMAVDDSESVLKVLRVGLTQYGFEVKTYAKPADAKAFFAVARTADLPDVIILDIMMPDEDGITMLGKIRNAPLTAHIPVLAVSALDDETTRNDALLFGAADFISKPFRLDELAEKIRETAQAARNKLS